MFSCILLLSVSGLAASDIDISNLYSQSNRLFSEADATAIQSLFTDSAMIADYTQQRSITRLNRTLTSSGRVYIWPGYGMVWQTEKPYASLMLVGRTSMKQKVGSGRVSSMDVSGNQIYLAIAEALESIFSGNMSTVLDSFEAYYISSGSEWVIGLIPQEEIMKGFMSRIEIYGGEELESLTLTESSGETIRYEFANIEKRGLSADEEELFNI